MVKKKIEDIKINRKNITHIKPKKEVVFNSNKDLSPIVPTHQNTPKNKESTKYDFLNKKHSYSNHRLSTSPSLYKEKKSFNKFIFFAFVFSLIVGLLYLLSTVFFMAKVSITPKEEVFEIKHQEFSASKDKNIPFEIIMYEDKEYKDVLLTSTSEVSKNAKGEIILFNEYSTTPQKIVAGTFLSDENGKAYKLDTSITIPGYKIEKSKIIKGEVSVKITSFLAGEAYNGSPELFHINSFKGTTKYNKIYGKIKTPMSGGIAGLVYTLDDKEKDNILSKTTSFKEKLLRKLSAQIPEDYILYPDAVKYSFSLDQELMSKDSNLKVVLNGFISAVIFKKDILDGILINKILPKISQKERAELLPVDLSVLIFNFKNQDQIIDKDMVGFNFELTGNLPIKWQPDKEEIKTLLLGVKKDDTSAVFKLDPGISTASIKIIPFWSKKLPENPKNIDIIVK